MKAKLLKQKQAIIKQMEAEFEATSEENRYFSIENIQKCDDDLTQFIERLSNLDRNKLSQTDFEPIIYEICKNLATFNQNYEEIEYLHGFLYNGYTQELSNFIRKAIFSFGYQLPTPISIPTKVFSLKHSPKFQFEYFSVYIGNDSKESVSLIYNNNNQCFEYDENPYGDCHPLPIYNFQINSQHTEISFEVLSEGQYKVIKLISQHPKDAIWFKTLAYLHQNKIFTGEIPPYLSQITLITRLGKLYEFCSSNYTAEGEIISMYTEGTGTDIFAGNLDEKGNAKHFSSIEENTPQRLFLIHAVPTWKRFEVDNLYFKDDKLVVITQNNYHFYKEEWKLDIQLSKPQTFEFPVKTLPFMLTFLQEIFAEKPFVKEEEFTN
ncbi:hypothetical protein CGC48_01300 [Capnocytophaga cynodegmi]|uniref:Uncharacterized protein n=1 Tax=Capnocytophaga cynodegmi TaxID=28189 RepID=A0A250E6K9_9FLAO|nr:hypothetical protein [Capnocytophaga cynodegmi]ATA67378.1 hypothetical protein CGC48_01300 [Capnocytophaga cynodegmi]